MSSRLLDISTLLAEYSLGNFDYKVGLSENLDELDSIISGINMLGEELNATTVSRDFFSSIYNNVTNFIFTVSEDGIIVDQNKALADFVKESCFGKPFFSFLNTDNDALDFGALTQKIDLQTPSYAFETEMKLANEVLFCSCVITQITHQEHKRFIIVVEDVTEKKETEKRILRAILQTEEAERKRLADDLHDSLGQRLSSVKILLGLARNNTKSINQKEFLATSIDILENSILELRKICFDLMPTSLENGGLCAAIEQMIAKIPFNITFETNSDYLYLDKKREVAVYRVIQEFINNSIKHSQAKDISIKIDKNPKQVITVISDNGKGFDLELNKNTGGRGLNTMRSRVESYGGKYQLNSSLGKGVNLKITFDV